MSSKARTAILIDDTPTGLEYGWSIPPVVAPALYPYLRVFFNESVVVLYVSVWGYGYHLILLVGWSDRVLDAVRRLSNALNKEAKKRSGQKITQESVHEILQKALRRLNCDPIADAP